MLLKINKIVFQIVISCVTLCSQLFTLYFLSFFFSFLITLMFFQIDEWLDYAPILSSGPAFENACKYIDEYLEKCTFLVGYSLSIADLAIWAGLAGKGFSYDTTPVALWHCQVTFNQPADGRENHVFDYILRLFLCCIDANKLHAFRNRS